MASNRLPVLPRPPVESRILIPAASVAKLAGMSQSFPSNRTGARVQVTLRDIAKQCGVSKITVSCALRGDRRNCSAQTIERVQAAASAMGYDPARAHMARRLSYARSDRYVLNHLVALFFPFGNLHMHYWALIFEGLQTQLSAQDFGILTCVIDPHRQPRADQFSQPFRRGDVDCALIFPGGEWGRALVKDLRRLPGFGQRPIYTLIETLPGCPALLMDDEQVGYLAAQHLLALGHRELLCFANSRFAAPITQHRLDGHRRALTEHGLDPQRSLRIADWIWDDPRGLAAALQDELRKYPGVTGILCPNDGIGIPLCWALRKLGKSVPGDYSLIGTDDSEELLDDVGQNIWTTVRLPLCEIGKLAAGVLLEAFTQPAVVPKPRALTGELVIRGTTAPPRRVGPGKSRRAAK